MVEDAISITRPDKNITTAFNAIPRVNDDKILLDAYWPHFGNKDQIPLWLRDNDFILKGHPMPTYSYKKSFRLWLCMHMETMNIWTHALGSAMFIATGIGLYIAASPSGSENDFTAGDLFAFGIFTSAAASCFGLSATFHTLRSHSYQVHHLWGRFDILGICLLAVGGATSATYYAWMCDSKIRNVYLSLNAASAIAAATTLFSTGGGGNKMRMLRGSVFTALAASALLPIYHRVGILGWGEACIQIGARWYLAEAISLLAGVCLFVSRIPERLSPGTFDVFGHSHQLHHIFAVIASGFHVVGLVTAHNYAKTDLSC